MTRIPAVIICEYPPHELVFTSHEHLGPGRHRLTAKCSCGERTYSTTSLSDNRGRNNLRDQHIRHLKEVERCSTST